jgi:hypothetical protein
MKHFVLVSTDFAASITATVPLAPITADDIITSSKEFFESRTSKQLGAVEATDSEIQRAKKLIHSLQWPANDPLKLRKLLVHKPSHAAYHLSMSLLANFGCIRLNPQLSDPAAERKQKSRVTTIDEQFAHDLSSYVLIPQLVSHKRSDNQTYDVRCVACDSVSKLTSLRPANSAGDRCYSSRSKLETHVASAFHLMCVNFLQGNLSLGQLSSKPSMALATSSAATRPPLPSQSPPTPPSLQKSRSGSLPTPSVRRAEVSRSLSFPTSVHSATSSSVAGASKHTQPLATVTRHPVSSSASIDSTVTPSASHIASRRAATSSSTIQSSSSPRTTKFGADSAASGASQSSALSTTRPAVVPTTTKSVKGPGATKAVAVTTTTTPSASTRAVLSHTSKRTSNAGLLTSMIRNDALTLSTRSSRNASPTRETEAVMGGLAPAATQAAAQSTASSGGTPPAQSRITMPAARPKHTAAPLFSSQAIVTAATLIALAKRPTSVQSSRQAVQPLQPVEPAIVSIDPKGAPTLTA